MDMRGWSDHGIEVRGEIAQENMSLSLFLGPMQAWVMEFGDEGGPVASKVLTPEG